MPSPTLARLSQVWGLGSRSLSRQLLLWVVIPQVVLWLGAGVATYQYVLGYANKAIDASLLQASRALARQLKPIGSGLLIDLPRAAQDILEADPNDRLIYTVSTPPGAFILGNQALPLPPNHVANMDPPLWDTPVFYDGEMHNSDGKARTAPPKKLRVAAIYLQFGDPQQPQSMLIQVGRSSTNREELAGRILVDMLLPLFSLVFLMSLVVWLGIRAGLSPLTRLRQQVEGRAPSDLAPLQLATAPTELLSLVQAINGLLDEVQRSVNRQKRFTADAAHQLRTPLAGLKSQTELALAETADPALKQRLQRVHDSATRSAHLVAQLLTLAKAEPGSRFAMAPLDLTQLANQATADWVPKALHKDIDLGLDDTPHPPIWMAGNAMLLREALVNVLDNALQYAGAGAEVTVRVQTHGPWAELSVSDNGPGIAADEKAHVFERFHRATDQGNGCGLGLAIVKEIVEQHQGQVLLSDTAPHGLTVTLRLPLASAPPA